MPCHSTAHFCGFTISATFFENKMAARKNLALAHQKNTFLCIRHSLSNDWHSPHCHVFVSASSLTKASKNYQSHCIFLASPLQWEGHSQCLGYGQVRLPKGHRFSTNPHSITAQASMNLIKTTKTPI